MWKQLFEVSLFIVAFFAANSDSANDNDCTLLLNELNTGSPGAVKNKDFIELEAMCENERRLDSLQGYKIIGISAGVGANKKKQEMTIDLIINLWNEKMKVSNLFTIGSKNVPNVDLTEASPFFSYRNKYTGNTNSMFSFLTKSDNQLNAIAIIYKKGFSFPQLVLNNKNPFIAINNEIQDLIKSNLVDMMVYGKRATYDSCELFTNLWSEYANKQYVIREFDNAAKDDRTLNRCAFDRLPFVPEKFKLGAASPGKENDCTGTTFFLENYMSEMIQPGTIEAFDSNDIADVFTQDDSPRCSASVHASAYESIPDGVIERTIEREIDDATRSSCTSLNLGVNVGNIAQDVDAT